MCTAAVNRCFFIFSESMHKFDFTMESREVVGAFNRDQQSENNLCSICSKLFFVKNGENICQSCVIMRSCNPTKCTYQEQLKAKSIQNCEENTKKRIFNGWEASVNIVQKNGVIGQNIDIPLESREFGHSTKDTCMSRGDIGHQNLNQGPCGALLMGNRSMPPIFQGQEHLGKSSKVHNKDTTFINYCSLCQGMFTSLERRMICMNCELKVVGNTFTMLEQPLVPRKETDLNVPPMGNVSICNDLNRRNINSLDGRPGKGRRCNKEEIDISIRADGSENDGSSQGRPSRAVAIRGNSLFAGQYDENDCKKDAGLRLRKFKKHACEYCSRCFQNASFLKIHIRSHTGEKPFICTECGKQFSQSSSLNTHEKLKHSGNKPYKCEVCEKCFPIQNYLTLHFRTHTKEKPYRCHICDKYYSQKSSLSTHMKKHG